MELLLHLIAMLTGQGVERLNKYAQREQNRNDDQNRYFRESHGLCCGKSR
jgi:hypothetical protein